MAITVTEIFDDTFVDVDSSSGISSGSAARCFLVQGVTGASPNDLEINAFGAIGIPSESPHPTIGGLYLKGFRAKPVGSDSGPTLSKADFRVLLKYKSNDFAPALGAVKIEIFGSNATTIMNRWPVGTLGAGDPIIIAYNTDPNSNARFERFISPATIDPENDADNGTYYDTAQVPVLSPNTIIRFTRRESGSPLTKSQQFRRTVNATAWMGFDPFSVLCRAIDGVNLVGVGSVIAQNMYDVTYDFEHNPEFGGWARVEIFRDRFSGGPIPGVDPSDGTNNGYQIVLPYRPMDFNTLNLPNAR